MAMFGAVRVRVSDGGLMGLVRFDGRSVRGERGGRRAARRRSRSDEFTLRTIRRQRCGMQLVSLALLWVGFRDDGCDGCGSDGRLRRQVYVRHLREGGRGTNGGEAQPHTPASMNPLGREVIGDEAGAVTRQATRPKGRCQTCQTSSKSPTSCTVSPDHLIDVSDGQPGRVQLLHAQ
jgi:hypothetical protein